ncbi:MAG: lipid-binding SYLF domain-containing protein [Pseudomonadota bacterium]|nr:lipid-binding SYLF domain-containing protein [Pseudomonadota bacterium]
MRQRTTALTGLIFLMFFLANPTVAGWDPNEETEAQAAVTAFKLTDPDLKAFFEKAHGYAVFPAVGKAGMGFGGAYGKGIVYEQGKEIGNTSLKQLSMGFQFGGESYREIIFFEDADTLNKFKEGNYELGAQATAVVVKKGAAKNSDFSDGVAVFTQTKGGMMFDVSVAGQKFTFEPK